MVVVPPIYVNTTASKELLQFVQNMYAPRSLNHNEVRLDLPPDLHLWATEERSTETALPVYETDDPLLESRPFLLIFRTPRIVTASHVSNLKDRVRQKLASSEGIHGFSSK